MKEIDVITHPDFVALQDTYKDAVLVPKDEPKLTAILKTDVSVIYCTLPIGVNKTRDFKFLVQQGVIPTKSIDRAYAYSKALLAKDQALEVTPVEEVAEVSNHEVVKP